MKQESETLTLIGNRERQVLMLVADGHTSAKIGEQLGISAKTVETHRRNIVGKLRIRGTENLTKYAIREGLVQL